MRAGRDFGGTLSERGAICGLQIARVPGHVDQRRLQKSRVDRGADLRAKRRIIGQAYGNLGIVAARYSRSWP
jgi:hypothetical protein